MIELDHITIIAPSLVEGVAHVQDCIGLDIPFGTRHRYMGTHNHRLQLGDRTYLEIVALDPEGADPGRARWFGLDNQAQIRADWDAGRRLRGWVARTADLGRVLSAHPDTFGQEVSLPPERPEFGFSIPEDGGLPMAGAAPSLIDHRGDPTSMADIPDLGARLLSFTLEHPDPAPIASLFDAIGARNGPDIVLGPSLRYTARIATPAGVRDLT